MQYNRHATYSAFISPDPASPIETIDTRKPDLVSIMVCILSAADEIRRRRVAKFEGLSTTTAENSGSSQQQSGDQNGGN
jgi:flagellar biosynthesis regulator FlaF